MGYCNTWIGLRWNLVWTCVWQNICTYSRAASPGLSSCGVNMGRVKARTGLHPGWQQPVCSTLWLTTVDWWRSWNAVVQSKTPAISGRFTVFWITTVVRWPTLGCMRWCQERYWPWWTSMTMWSVRRLLISVVSLATQEWCKNTDLGKLSRGLWNRQRLFVSINLLFVMFPCSNE